MVDEDVAALDLLEEVGRSIQLGDAGLRGGEPGLLGEVGAIDRGELHQVGQSEQTGVGVQLVFARVEPGEEPIAHGLRHLLRDLDAHRVAETPPSQLELDSLQQVVRFVGDLEVGVTRHAEGCAFADLHLREERRQKVGDHVLERQVQPSMADRKEPRQQLRHLDPCEALFARFRIPHEETE